MKIAVCTLCINDWYYDIVKYGVKSIENYAKRHGYDFYACNDVYEKEGGTRDYPWYKILALQKILPKYDMVFWIDADGFVLKPEVLVTDFVNVWLPEGKDILITRDCNNICNTGVMIWKNTPFCHALLHEIWNNKEEFDTAFHEQASLCQIISTNRLNSQNKIQIIPIEKRNTFYSYWAEYFPGNCFFIHIARCAHDPCGFVYTLDCYCPIKMDEDVEDEYEDRVKWLNDRTRCRRDIELWVSQKIRTRESTRSKLYRKRFQDENLAEKIKNAKLKKNL